MNTASPARKRPPWRTIFFILLCIGIQIIWNGYVALTTQAG